MSDMSGIAGWVACAAVGATLAAQLWRSAKGAGASLIRGAKVYDVLIGKPDHPGMVDRWGAVEETLAELRNLPSELAAVSTLVQGLVPKLTEATDLITALTARVEALEAEKLQVQPASAATPVVYTTVRPAGFDAIMLDWIRKQVRRDGGDDGELGQRV